jgi:hypothetical protein
MTRVPAIGPGTSAGGSGSREQRGEGRDVGEHRVAAEPEVVKHALHGRPVPAAARVGHDDGQQAEVDGVRDGRLVETS